MHVSLDLVTLEFVEIHLTDAHVGESLTNFSFRRGDVVIADRGYSRANKMVETAKRGAELIVRMSVENLPLYYQDGKPLDMVALLKLEPRAPVVSVPVLIQSTTGEGAVTAWVHAARLSQEQTHRARQRMRQRSRKKGRTPSEQSLFLAGWVLVFTTLEPERLSAETILKLYRLRWQVELAIKRWKSLLDLSELRARRESPLAQVWLHSKLLYALLLERRMRRRLGQPWGWLDRERPATWWRVYKLIADEMAPVITGSLGWNRSAWSAGLKVLAERRRKRKLQRLPDEAVQFLQTHRPSLCSSLKAAA